MRWGRIVVALWLVGCAHKRPPPPVASAPAAAKPVPMGDLLRFVARPGERTMRRVKMTIETEAQRSAPIVLQFSFGEEERVVAVRPDGRARLEARLVDVVGKALGGADQAIVDAVALAFDELKVRFERGPRGEVGALDLVGLRPPLEETTARQVLEALLGAQRGPLLPVAPVAVGGHWTTRIPLARSTGYDGAVQYEYAYARKDGGLVGFTGEGRIDAKPAEGQAGRLTSTSSADYRFELATGRLVGSTVQQRTEMAAGDRDVRQHMTVEWSLGDEEQEESKR